MIDIAIETRAGCIVLMVFLCAAYATAQREILPETPVTLSGTLSAGFAGGTGSEAAGPSSSSESTLFGVAADLSGYYYDPRFLQFSVSPRFMWNRAGTGIASEAVTARDNGVTANAQLLEGSSFPMHFGYGLSQTVSTSLSGGPTPFTVAGSGLAQTFSVGASTRRFASLPSLNINYSYSTTDTSVTGVETPSEHMSNDFLTLFSSYKRLGFLMNATYSRNSSTSTTQDLLNLGVPYAPSTTTGQSESFGVGHDLPLHGFASVSVGRSSDSYTANGAPQSDSFDSASAGVALRPTDKLSWNADGTYTSNATNQAITAALNGQPATPTVLGTGRALELDTTGTYIIGRGFAAGGTGVHSSESVSGADVTQNLALGSIFYHHSLWHGNLSLSYSPGWSSVSFNEVGAASLTDSGLYNSATATYQHPVGRWAAQGSFSFMEDNAYVTGAPTQATNSLSLSGSIRTKVHYNWMLMFNGTVNRSQVPGFNGNLGELFAGQISNRTWSFNGQFQRNKGYYLFAGSTTPVAGATSASGILTFYDTSDSYTFSGSYNQRTLSLSAAYSYTTGVADTLTVPVTTANGYLQALLYYKFRKLDFQAGYRRLTQSASSNHALDQVSTGYWVSVIRKFQAF